MKNLFNISFIFSLLILFMGELLSQNITYTYSWYKYYTPVEGKIIGIWPHLNRWYDIEKLKELKYRWGFNYILFWEGLGQDELNRAKQIGYSPSTNIMRIVEPENYQAAGQYEQCWAYYVDEPADRQIPFTTVQTMKSWLNANFPIAPFIISGYKRNSDLINYTNSLADIVLFSSYVHWREVFGIWVSWPVNPDQRDDWTDMKNLFGNKFSMTWISAYSDLSEYEQLFGHAANLGLKGIWLYHYNVDLAADDDNDNINSFCEAAVNGGYLTVDYQQVRDSYVNGVFTERQYVGPPYSSIPATYDHSNMIFTDLTVTDNRVDDYFASNSIVAGSPYFYIVPPSKESSFNSNNEIILKPGFHAELGSEFRAYITEEP
jgi:hypothetical protein